MIQPVAAPDRYARVHGSAGAQPRLRGLMLVILPVLAVVGAAGYVLGAALPHPPLGTSAAGALLIVLVLLLAVAVQRSRRNVEDFLKGARGEESVGRILSLLPDTYDVFHGLELGQPRRQGGGDLDHVAVGPTGVFVIETKNWAGAIRIESGMIRCDGQAPDRDPLAQVGRAADALRARLRDVCGQPIAVQPILCFTTPENHIASVGVAGVIVCNDRHLLAAVQEHTDAPVPPALQTRLVAALEAYLVG